MLYFQYAFHLGRRTVLSTIFVIACRHLGLSPRRPRVQPIWSVRASFCFYIKTVGHWRHSHKLIQSNLAFPDLEYPETSPSGRIWAETAFPHYIYTRIFGNSPSILKLLVTDCTHINLYSRTSHFRTSNIQKLRHLDVFGRKRIFPTIFILAYSEILFLY